MKKYILIQKESNTPWKEYKEEFDTLQDAQERMHQMYRDVAINGAELIEAAGYKDTEAYAEFEDHNVVSWSIEEYEG